MKREIKFRAWLPTIKKMAFAMPLFGLIKTGDAIRVSGKDEFPSDIIFLQYTGLKDKNGVEIFEGDLLQYSGLVMSVNHGAYIEATDGNCPRDGHNAHGWYMTDLEEKNIKSLLTSWALPSMKEIEVIGNIYENPELLQP